MFPVEGLDLRESKEGFFIGFDRRPTWELTESLRPARQCREGWMRSGRGEDIELGAMRKS